MPDQAIADPDYPKWQPLAENTRAALRLLAYDGPDCLPGEPAACGGNFAEHALAHLAALRAVVEHRIAHLGTDAQPLVSQIYATTRDQLAAEDAGDRCDEHAPVPRYSCEHQASNFFPCRTCGA